MEKERGVAAVAVDYCFLRNVVGGDHVPAPLLAAHVGPPKGVDLEWVSEQLVRDGETRLWEVPRAIDSSREA